MATKLGFRRAILSPVTDHPAQPRPEPWPAPPSPPRRPRTLTAHGDQRVDDWAWLADRDDPAVLAHLKAENAYTQAITAPTVPLQERLYAEMVARIQQSDLSVPVRKGRWSWYTRTEEGRQYAIHCRRPSDGHGSRSEATCVDSRSIWDATHTSGTPDAQRGADPAAGAQGGPSRQRAPRGGTEPAQPGADPEPPSPDEQVILDENELAAGHDYFSLGGLP